MANCRIISLTYTLWSFPTLSCVLLERMGRSATKGRPQALSSCTVPNAGPYRAIHSDLCPPPRLSTFRIFQGHTWTEKSICFPFIPGMTSFQTLQKSFKATGAAKSSMGVGFVGRKTVHRSSISPSFSPPPEGTLISQETRFLHSEG